MSKTSIDGLVVRSSNKKHTTRPSTHRVVGQSNRRIDGIRTKSTKTTKKPKISAEDEFLAPVENLWADETDTSLGAVDDAAWTELLEGFGDAEPASNDLGLQRHADSLLEDEAPKPRPKKDKRSRRRKKIHLPHIKHPVLLTVVILLVGLGTWGFVWGDNLISRLTGGKSGLWDAIGALVSSTVPFDTDANGRTNVLVFGTEGYDMSGSTDYANRDSSSGTHDGAQLTDSIMVISFDQNTQDVALLSLPRDLKVPAACSAGKVNEVYYCNNQNGTDEAAGAEALMRQLSAVLGIEFQYWAHVNWGSLADIVDTLGGITVTLDEDINDYYYTTMVISAGVPTRLNGVQAVALARARHGTTGGDFTRGNSQQKIVEGIVQEIVSNGVNISEAFGLLNILGDNLRSNFSADNIKAGVKLASTFNANNIRNVPLVDYDNNIYYVKTSMINGISYVVPAAGATDYSQIHDYVAKMFSSDPAVREDASIAVYNATDVAGVAASEKANLEASNYQVVAVGDATAESCGEKFCLYMLNDKPATRAALEARYNTMVQDATSLPNEIWPGTADFVLIIGQVD